jgi:hypothetical protein
MFSCGQSWLLPTLVLVVVLVNVSGQNITERSLDEDEKVVEYGK